MLDIPTFLADRKAAFLSMDEAVIRVYAKKYGVELPDNPDLFWISVHMARTGDRTLPMTERSESKAWLTARGYRSMDDGNVAS